MSHDVLPEVSGYLAATTKELFVAGTWKPARTGETFATLDPASGQELAQIARADAGDVAEAVQAAQAAFDDPEGWSHWPPAERARVMHTIADLIERDLEPLSELETLDSGKPLWMSRLEVGTAADQYRYYAGWCTKVSGRVAPSHPGRSTYILREPVGVCAAIAPWNYPMIMAAQKTAPGLATGNVVIFKPAEQSPLTALWFAQLAEEAGLPAGALSVLTGFGEEAGAALARHPGVALVSFTGSTAVGREIMRMGSEGLKRVSLELGGKSPNIVLKDADLHRAAAEAAQAVFFNTGQTCTAGARVIVEAPVYDDFVDLLAGHAAELRVGPGLDAETMVGPLISAVQRDRVDSYVEQGRADGLEIVTGGSRMDVAGHEGGWFYAPTVFGGVPNEHRLAQEEIFGPVAVAEVVADADEAVAVANASSYGLAAGLWTENLSIAHRMIGRLKAGTVWVNCYGLFDPSVPFGGMKESGSGRELGEESLTTYTQTKSVWIQHG